MRGPRTARDRLRRFNGRRAGFRYAGIHPQCVQKALDEGRTRYIEDQGVLEFRQAICEKMERDNGLHYTPDEVMVTTGVAMGMFIALLSTLDPGDEVMIPDPVYITYPQIPLIAGAKIVTYDILEDNDYQSTSTRYALRSPTNKGHRHRLPEQPDGRRPQQEVRRGGR